MIFRPPCYPTWRLVREAGIGRRGAFTLVELLVVVAVIAVLASLLLPALSSARRRAESVQCINNLRQINQAVLLFAQENDDALPFAWFDDISPKVNNFFALLTPHINGSRFDGYSDFELPVFLCPARRREPLQGVNPVRISYGMNAHNSVDYPDRKTRTLAEAQAGDASVRLLVVDIAATYNHPPVLTFDPTQVGYKHQGKANILFFDGHVASHSPRQTNGLRLEF